MGVWGWSPRLAPGHPEVLRAQDPEPDRQRLPQPPRRPAVVPAHLPNIENKNKVKTLLD